MEKNYFKFAVLVEFRYEDGSSSVDLLVKRCTNHAITRFGSLRGYCEFLLDNTPCTILEIIPIDACRIDYEF